MYFLLCWFEDNDEPEWHVMAQSEDEQWINDRLVFWEGFYPCTLVKEI